MSKKRFAKFAVIGDIHFGVRGNSHQILKAQKKWFLEELMEKTEGVSELVFLGDIFDSRNSLSPVVMKNAREIFQVLCRNFSKVHVILGNHDIFYRNTKDIHTLDILRDQGALIYEDHEEVEIGGKNCLMLPWIANKAELLEVSKTLVKNKYDYAFGHLEVNEFQKVRGVFEKEGMSTDLFSNVGRVYSGHFHLKDIKKNINYVGTPYELTWNDYKDEKGFWIVDTENDSETFVASETTPKHLKIHTKKINIKKIDRELVENNILKLIFNDETEVEKINFIEKINSLEPFSLTVDDGENPMFANDEGADIEADIKDTLTFLNDYVQMIEVPENLNKKILMNKLEEIHKECL
jgi:DNA repair exonuclease SbcCD nuclease subunit